MSEVINVSKDNVQQPEVKKYEFDFDELKMFFREPYVIEMEGNKYLEIKQPSIYDILELGDREVYSYISPFVANTTSYRVLLWDIGKDWNKMSDYELFSMLIPTIKNVGFLFKVYYFVENPDYNCKVSDEENVKLGNERHIKIYKDIDFSKLKQYSRPEDKDKDIEYLRKNFVLYDPDQEIIIDENVYMHIRAYIRMMFDQHPKEEFAKGKLAKKWIIDEEKDKMKLEAEKNSGRKKSVLLPMVSGLLNHPGFKYDLDGIKKLGIFAFMDSVRRLQVYEQCVAFMGGMYSGFMDTSKLGQQELNKRTNWLQDVYEE